MPKGYVIEKPCTFAQDAAVICNAAFTKIHKCELCGWNPEVKEKRLVRIRERENARKESAS